MKYIIFLFAFFCSSYSFSQHQRKNIQIQFDNYETSKMDSLELKINVYLLSGFDDSIIVMYDDSILLNSHCKSDFSTSNSEKMIIIKYDVDTNKELLIKSITDGSELELEIMRGYRIIEVHKRSEGWDIIYSNVGIVFE